MKNIKEEFEEVKNQLSLVEEEHPLRDEADHLEEYDWWVNAIVNIKMVERAKFLAKVGKVIDDFLDKDYIEIMEIKNILDVLRDDIIENVESVDVDGKAFSRTSDIDNSIDAKENEIKEIWVKRLEELKQQLGIK